MPCGTSTARDGTGKGEGIEFRSDEAGETRRIEDGGGSTLTVVELETAHAEAAPPRSAWISASFRSHHGVVVDISDSRRVDEPGCV